MDRKEWLEKMGVQPDGGFVLNEKKSLNPYGSGGAADETKRNDEDTTVWKAIAGFNDVSVIFEISDHLYAVVDTQKERVRFQPYWLNVAKYVAVYDVSLLDDELVAKADKVLRTVEIPRLGASKAPGDGNRQKKNVIEEDQKKLLEQSRASGKGIFLN